MSYSLTVELDAVAHENTAALPLALAILGRWLWALVETNMLYMDALGSQIPILYESDIYYDRSLPEGCCEDDKWLDCVRVKKAGRGDCEELACYRVAELILRFGVAAKPHLVLEREEMADLIEHRYHVVVAWPEGLSQYPRTVRRIRLSNGRSVLLEDPSLELGMAA